MPTTSNFGWTTPADTDLVKDGAAAIRTLGNGVDSSFVDLKGGTTGQVLSKASNTDLDFTWSADAGIPATIVDAKGDLIAATAADTVSRLASSGVNNDVLTVDTSTATGLKWAALSSGGITLLTSGTLSGASVSLTSISGSYKDLILRIFNFKPATDGSQCYLQFNSDTGSNYYSSTATTTSVGSSTQISIIPATDDTTAQGVSDTTIINYASSSYNKLVENFASTNNSTTATNQRSQFLIGLWLSTNAITSIQLTTSSGNFTSGNYELYGVK